MADNGHGKGDGGHGGDHGGGHGDHGGGGDHAKAGGGKSGGGNWVTKLLRNPITWAVAGVGAVVAAVVGGGVQLPSVGTDSSPSYSVSDSQDTADGAPAGERRSVRYSARSCALKVEQARAQYGRDWERELSRKVRSDCGRTIQEARRDDRRAPQQAEGPRGRAPFPGDVEVQRVDVAYGDLDLSTPEGAERFLARLRNAVTRVCGGRPDLRDLEARRAFKACYDRNMDSAVAQTRAPRVSALHRRSG